MSKCCNSCAFLSANQGKPNPIDVQFDNMDWYSQENLDRLWDGTRDCGQFLTCHSTDPTYFAKDASGLTACIGFTLLVFMHLKIYESVGCNYSKYVSAVGRKVAMSRRGAAEAALSMAMGCGDLVGNFKIVREVNERRPLRYPSGFEKTVAAFEKLNLT